MPVSGPSPSPSIDDLRQLVGAGAGDAIDAVLGRCLTFGLSLVARYTQRVAGTIPAGILEEAVLAASADQWNRRKAPNGIVNQQFAVPDGVNAVPVRVGRDPLASIRPMLRPWVGGGLRSAPLVSPLDVP